MKAGFTLVEVLVVLAILGLSAGLAIPPLTRWATAADDSGVADVARVVRMAREEALRTATPVELVIDPATGRYWVTSHAGSPPLDESGLFSLDADSEIVRTADRLVLRWDALGGMTGDSIVMRDAGRHRVIRASPWTGTMSIHAR